MPPSTVVKVRISKPVVVSVGAVPPGQSTEPGQVIFVVGFVTSKVNVPALPVAGGLVNVNVVAPPIVAVIT